MVYAIGFLIALLIGFTGVGGGTITVPVLILFLHLDPVKAIGTALAFTAIVKMLAAPVYLWRRQVHFRTFARMAMGGLPGLLVGMYFLKLSAQGGWVTAAIGPLIMITALTTVWKTLRGSGTRQMTDRSYWLPWIMAPIGAEVGFSSAGAGAIGSIALFNLTQLSPAEVVGTDILFGLTLSFVGGGIQMSGGRYSPETLLPLAIGGVFGALIGPNLIRWLPPKPVRVGMCLWLASLGGMLLWKSL